MIPSQMHFGGRNCGHGGEGEMLSNSQNKNNLFWSNKLTRIGIHKIVRFESAK